MNKAELIDKISAKLDLPKKQVEDVLDTMESTIIDELKSDNEVSLTGFGTFMSRRREARGGVNPQNPSERIQIPAVTVPKFKAGKTLKDSLKSDSGSETKPAAPAQE
ncbi:HU family DNA-binding protein [Patescibacteria group bacterium]